MPQVRFSIVVICYNQREFIRAAVESALLQSRSLREIIVVDDGSTDGSKEILQEYSSSIELLCLPGNRGAIEARNQGAAHAKGQYLVFLDGDDLLMPWALEAYERIVAERNPKVLLAKMLRFTGALPEVETPSKLEVVEYEYLMAKDRQIGLFASGFVVERKAFEEVGRWTPGIFHMDLQDIYSKLGYSGRSILICAPATAFYRVHATNSIHNYAPFIQMQYRLMSKQRRGEYPGGKWRYERRAWLGGQVMFCLKRAVHGRFYLDIVRLSLSGATMILALLVRKSVLAIKGHRPVEILDFPFQQNASSKQDRELCKQ